MASKMLSLIEGASLLKMGPAGEEKEKESKTTRKRIPLPYHLALISRDYKYHTSFPRRCQRDGGIFCVFSNSSCKFLVKLPHFLVEHRHSRVPKRAIPTQLMAVADQPQAVETAAMP